MAFVRPHNLVFAAVALTLFSLLLDLISIAAVGWLTLQTEVGKVAEGLWRQCLSPASGSPSCVTLEIVPHWLETVRAFAVLAVLELFACLGCVAVVTFVSQRKLFTWAVFSVSAIASLCLLIEFATYADNYQDAFDILGSTLSYDYCFYLNIIAWILCTGATGLYIIGYTRSSGYQAVA